MELHYKFLCWLSIKIILLSLLFRDAHMPKHTGTVIKCDFCAFTTKNKRLLAVHVTNRHKEHKLICDQCDYSTNSKFHFNQHYQSKHEGVTYKCKWCDYSAITLQYLQKHQRRHEGKAYNCEFEGCSFVAPYPSDLTIHVNAVHKKVRLKCPECDYKAARKGDLNKVLGSQSLKYINIIDRFTHYCIIVNKSRAPARVI